MNKIALISGLLTLSLLSCESVKPTIVSTEDPLSTADEVLMTQVQKDVLKYFWEYAESNSMLGRERYHEDGIYPQNDKNVITTGGSGFGMMTILVGVERNFIPRKEAVKRLTTMADFLAKMKYKKLIGVCFMSIFEKAGWCQALKFDSVMNIIIEGDISCR